MLDDAFVRLVQTRLRDAGHYTGRIDGDAGPATLTALDKAIPPPLVVEPRSVDTIPDAGDAKLTGVHPRLARLIREASNRSPVPFTVIEGLRTSARQAQLVKAGASKTMRSRHLTGHAVDLWPLDPAGKPLPAGTKEREAALWAALLQIIGAVKLVAREQGTAITCGLDWGGDAPHVEIDPTIDPM